MAVLIRITKVSVLTLLDIMADKTVPTGLLSLFGLVVCDIPIRVVTKCEMTSYPLFKIVNVLLEYSAGK